MMGKLRMSVLIGAIVLFVASAGIFAQGKSEDHIEPKVISAPQPEYPRESKEAGLEGTVSVRVRISEEGNVISADSPAGIGRNCDIKNFPPIELLYKAVLSAVKSAKFTPATRNGKPVEAVIWLNTTFRLPPQNHSIDGSVPPGDRPKIVDGGIIVGRAKSLPKPDYPPAARAVRASGAVSVRVTFNEDGSVVLARALTGHPLLRSAAEEAACHARFTPVNIDGRPISVTGVITYAFQP